MSVVAGVDVDRVLSQLERLGWAVIDGVDSTVQADLRNGIRAIELDRGWHLRTMYHPTRCAVSLLRHKQAVPPPVAGRPAGDGRGQAS